MLPSPTFARLAELSLSPLLDWRVLNARTRQMTDIFEGSIIRSFRRLQELLRQMGGAARAIGNADLETKFEDAIKLLERPNTVVFNPSYVDFPCRSSSYISLSNIFGHVTVCTCRVLVSSNRRIVNMQDSQYRSVRRTIWRKLALPSALLYHYFRNKRTSSDTYRPDVCPVQG